MGPCMVVLCVNLERRSNECELRSGLSCDHQDKPSVVPDLVGFEERHRELVHQLELDIERRFEGEQGFVSVLPVGRIRSSELVRELVRKCLWLGHAPCRVVCRILTDDGLGELKNSFTLLSGFHDAPEIVSRIFIWIEDGSGQRLTSLLLDLDARSTLSHSSE